MTEQHWEETCKACYGLGIQTNKGGIRVTCPVCSGTGKVWRSNYDNLPPGVCCCYDTRAFFEPEMSSAGNVCRKVGTVTY